MNEWNEGSCSSIERNATTPQSDNSLGKEEVNYPRTWNDLVGVGATATVLSYHQACPHPLEHNKRQDVVDKKALETLVVELPLSYFQLNVDSQPRCSTAVLHSRRSAGGGGAGASSMGTNSRGRFVIGAAVFSAVLSSGEACQLMRQLPWDGKLSTRIEGLLIMRFCDRARDDPQISQG